MCIWSDVHEKAPEGHHDPQAVESLCPVALVLMRQFPTPSRASGSIWWILMDFDGFWFSLSGANRVKWPWSLDIFGYWGTHVKPKHLNPENAENGATKEPLAKPAPQAAQITSSIDSSPIASWKQGHRGVLHQSTWRRSLQSSVDMIRNPRKGKGHAPLTKCQFSTNQVDQIDWWRKTLWLYDLIFKQNVSSVKRSAQCVVCTCEWCGSLEMRVKGWKNNIK